VSQQYHNVPDDVLVVITGDRFPACAGPIMRARGWRGGLWVKYVPPTGVDDYMIEASDGNETTGFTMFPAEAYKPGELWGAVSNFTGQQLRTDAGSVSGASTITIVAGGGRFLFLVYETTALDAFGARAGGPATYALNEELKVSENGYLCNDPDPLLALAGVTAPKVVGVCCAVPSQRTGNRLGMDLKF
jgi:hypothetical protein